MNHKYKGKKVKVHGIFQQAQVLEPSIQIGGHNGGQIAYPVAVIEYEDGHFEQIVSIYKIEGWKDCEAESIRCTRCQATSSKWLLNGDRVEFCGYCGNEIEWSDEDESR